MITMPKPKNQPPSREALLAAQGAHRESHGKKWDPDACETCWSYTLALLGVRVDPNLLT